MKTHIYKLWLHEYNETLVGIRKDNRMGITIKNDGTKEKTNEGTS